MDLVPRVIRSPFPTRAFYRIFGRVTHRGAWGGGGGGGRGGTGDWGLDHIYGSVLLPPNGMVPRLGGCSEGKTLQIAYDFQQFGLLGKPWQLWLATAGHGSYIESQRVTVGSFICACFESCFWLQGEGK